MCKARSPQKPWKSLQVWLQLGVSLFTSLRLLTSSFPRVSRLAPGGDLPLEPGSQQGSPVAAAPAVFRGPQESGLSLWETFWMDFLGTDHSMDSCLGQGSQSVWDCCLSCSTQSPAGRNHNSTKSQMLESDTLRLFSLFVSCAYLENYKVRSRRVAVM